MAIWFQTLVPRVCGHQNMWAIHYETNMLGRKFSSGNISGNVRSPWLHVPQETDEKHELGQNIASAVSPHENALKGDSQKNDALKIFT